MNTPSPSRKLGRRIRTLREAADLTTEALAETAAVAVERLAAFEAGTADADYRALLRIARALGRPVADLLSAVEEDDDDARGEA